MLLTPSRSPRYLHSASIINGMLLVFGGSGHNVTDENSADTCFSPNFLAYDIACDRWRNLPAPKISNDFEALYTGKYGHSSIVYEDAVYIFGGFNGLMTPTLLKYVPANCTDLVDEKTCTSTRMSSKCVWNAVKSVCQFYTLIKSSSGGLHYPRDEPYCLGGEAESSGGIVSVDYTYLCARQTVCSNCVQSSYNCVWCRDHCVHRKCDKSSSWKSSSTSSSKEIAVVGGGGGGGKAINDYNMCDARKLQIYNCDKMHNCQSCHFEHYCKWASHRMCTSLNNVLTFDRALAGSSSDTAVEAVGDERGKTCEVPCYLRTTCENCTQGSCLWCSSLERCIDSNAYSIIYPIGQCMEWTTHPHMCSMLSCTELKSCNLCLKVGF